MKRLLVIPMLLICSSVNATTCDDACMKDCTWIKDAPTSTNEWVSTSSTESGFTSKEETKETKEPIKFEKHINKGGWNDQNICYHLQNDTEFYKDYTVAKATPTSKNVSLYKDGILQRECDFKYYDIHAGNSSGKHSWSNKTETKIPWETTTKSGYWKVTVTENGHWECETSPVPEPTTILLFGIGLTGLALLRKKCK